MNRKNAKANLEKKIRKLIRKTLKKLVAWITSELQQSNKNNIEKKEKKLFLETQTLSAKKEQHRFQVHDFNSIYLLQLQNMQDWREKLLEWQIHSKNWTSFTRWNVFCFAKI